MNKFLRAVFGAKGQIVVGVLFLFLAIVQTIYWTWFEKPTVRVLFIVSMEALIFAAYAIIATGLGYRATERVEQIVVEQADVDVTVER